MMQPAISTDFLTKTYGQVNAVRELNLNVPRGAIYGFLGRNGAGKTTTIKMLLGLARPTSGSARVLGMNTETDRIAIFQRTAFVSEKKTLYPLLTPNELVRFSRGFYPTWDDAAVEKYSHLLEIPMTQRFDKLSNGNQTKVFLLLALAQGADLLILDEPTTALDPLTADEFLRVLAASAMERGCTVFFSSHQLEEVERIAEYVGVMDLGKLMLESRLDDIKSEFRLIIAVGNSLPRQTSPQVLSVRSEGNCCRYFVTQDADGFAAKLTQNGATVTQVVSLGLREIFLQLVRKELPCTSGSAGATLVGSSSFS
jgi:ABC-2 type transport system ATP-binding protein